MDFANIIREEAVLFLLDLPRGDEVSILAQKKKDGQYHGRTCMNVYACARLYSQLILLMKFQLYSQNFDFILGIST